MAFFDWNDQLATGIPAIDAQHKELVALVNKLHEAMRAGKGKQELGAVLDGLASYTIQHFATEERAFLTYGYPEKEDHAAEHESLIGKVQALQAEYARGDATITIDTLTFLVDWVKNHIKGTDMKYVPFLKGKEIR